MPVFRPLSSRTRRRLRRFVSRRVANRSRRMLQLALLFLFLLLLLFQLFAALFAGVIWTGHVGKSGCHCCADRPLTPLAPELFHLGLQDQQSRGHSLILFHDTGDCLLDGAPVDEASDTSDTRRAHSCHATRRVARGWCRRDRANHQCFASRRPEVFPLVPSGRWRDEPRSVARRGKHLFLRACNPNAQSALLPRS